MFDTALMGRLGNCFLVWRRWLAGVWTPWREPETVPSPAATRTGRVPLPADIADLLFCDRPTATVVIGNLEKAGWVERARDRENGKRVRISLTDHGREKLEEVRADPERPENRFDPVACFSAEEKAQLDALLTKLAKHLEALPPE
jgi:DNA-binding MarR family transcriptional regulator